MPYISILHNDDLSWHIFVDSILLDIFHGLVELFTTMIDLNKYVFHFYFFYFEFVAFFLVSNVSFFELMCRGVEFYHVKPNLVHEFFCIQGIGIIPLKQFKDVLPT
jgi:hypothetical protein